MAIPFVVGAGRFGHQILKTLYKGQKWVGKKTAIGADLAAKKSAEYAGKKGHAKTSQFITGVSKKGAEYSKAFGKTVKKYPKTSAAVTGAVAWDILDKD